MWVREWVWRLFGWLSEEVEWIEDLIKREQADGSCFLHLGGVGAFDGIKLRGLVYMYLGPSRVR